MARDSQAMTVCGRDGRRWRPLPPQLPHQRARRVAEQFLHRGRVELVDAFEFLGMDAAGHEQAIDPETVARRSGRSAPNRRSPAPGRATPDGRGVRRRAPWRAHRSAGAACRRRSPRRRARDRVRRSRRRNRSGGRRVRPRCRDWRRSAAACARAPAASSRDSLRPIRFRRRTGRCRRCSRPAPAAPARHRARDGSTVALRTDPEHLLAGVVGDEVPGQVAGTDDRVIGLVGDAELAQLPLHGIGRPRRVGDQDDGAAALAIGVQRLAGFGKRLRARYAPRPRCRRG